MNEEQPQQASNWPALKTALSGLAAEEIVNFIAHGGNLVAAGGVEAAIFGGAIAAIAGWNAPPVFRFIRDSLPQHEELKPFELLTRREPGGRSVVDRLMGHYPTEAELQEQPATNREALPPHKGKAQPALGEAVTEEIGTVNPLVPIFPRYTEDETLQLGQVLVTGQRFDPHINALFGKGLIASAVQGSGKSQLIGRIIEQAAKCGVPVVVFDHKGEYAPICDLPFVHGLRAGSEKLTARVPSAYNLMVDNADSFVALVMHQHHQAIVHLPSYGDGWVDRAAIVAEVGQALMRHANHCREHSIELIPCLVLLDEAQLYIPQNKNLLPPEAQKNAEVLDNLSNAYFALVSNGRSNGYTVGFATQSLTYVAKWAIKSCQIRIFGRHAEKNDLDMVESIINPNVSTREDMEALKPGQAVVFGFTPQPMMVQFDRRQSRDDSETPGIERLRRRTAAHTQPAQKREITMEDIMTLLNQREDVDPDDARYGGDEPIAFRPHIVRRDVEPSRTDLYARTEPVGEGAGQAQRTENVGSTRTTYNGSENAVRAPESTSQTTHESANYRRMTDIQAERFITAYKLTGNKDKSLKVAGVDTRWRQHGTVLIEQHGLKNAQ
jgi:hypothetical protein